MIESTRKASVGLLAIALAFPAASAAVPAEVQVRIEGRTQTLFEGPVTTDGHNITTPTSPDPHKCDGTNNGAYPAPGPTSGAALDDAARLGSLTWDGEWFQTSRTSRSCAWARTAWTRGTVSSGVSSSTTGIRVTGGCQERVATGDESTWVFDAFNKSKMLRLTGPETAQTGQAIEVRVVNTLVSAGDPPEPISGRDRGRLAHGCRRPGHAVLLRAGDLHPEGRALRLRPVQRRQALRRPAGGRPMQLNRQGRPDRDR